MTALSGLPVLVLDAQATGGNPGRGALVEMGWASWSADEDGELPLADVAAHVVARPPGAALPPAVSRLTGLGTADWARGVAPARVWERLEQASRAVAPGPGPVPVVVHFARFEEPFLKALHARHGKGPFRLDLVCTHAIARRLLPELPRRTLRALAGYFGAAVPFLRRSADHVVATAFVWRHLVALLEAREGIADLDDLRAWLARPARRTGRRFPLPRERRLELPDRPGVYRLLRTGGACLYVGKATSLRQRVGGHFHAQSGRGERALEMLTQVQDLSWSETETALEAALEEADEIKRLAPPYNVALARVGRSVSFARADLVDPQERADADHPVGPLVSSAPFEGIAALRTVLADGDAASASSAARSRAVGVEPAYAPGSGCFAEGVSRFAREHGRDASACGLLRLGARLWAERRVTPEPEPSESVAVEAEKPHRPAWDAERVAWALEETVLRAAHAVRRARWLTRLSESSLAWSEPGAARRRLLVVEAGAVTVRSYLEAGVTLPPPPGHARPPAERRTVFDLATFDRLRVLTTELRILAAGAVSVELRLGPHSRLSRRRLRVVLEWV